MKKNNAEYYIILAIVFILFNVCAFIFQTNKTNTFWCAYCFTVVAFIIETFALTYTINKNDNIKNKFFKLPILYIGVIYLIVQLIAFFVFMIFPHIMLSITFIICVLILGLSLILMIASNSAYKKNSTIESNNNSKKQFIKKLQFDLEMLAEVETNIVIKRSLEKLATDVRFSDPMSNDNLKDLEAKMEEKVEQMKSSDDKEKLIKEVNLLLIERNKKCLEGK